MREAKRLPMLVAVTVISLIMALLPAATPDLSSDRAALLTLRSAVGGRTYLWNVNDTTPCNWAGVRCENNRVAVLRLPGVAISGALPTGTVGNLTALRTLSLRLNALRGRLPADLASCVSLRNLYLQGNFFSGEIPDLLLSLPLVRLNLASNNFSGAISPGFEKLKRLRTFYVENNRLSGSIPALPSLDQFNVSNNALTGSIPAGLRKFSLSSFGGNSLCGKPLDLCPGETEPSGEVDINVGRGKRKGLSGGAVAGIVIGCVFAAILIAILLIVLCRKRRINKTRAVDASTALKHHPEDSNSTADKQPPPENGNGNGNGFPVAAAAVTAAAKSDSNASAAAAKKLVFFGKPGAFDLEDLLRASAEVLGKGTFGTAYKAVLEGGTVVAVKRLKDVTISDKEFREKIEGVGAMNHGNLVPLRAFYYSRDEKLLVYDYMPMGSLSALLHGNKGASRTPLNWEIRAGIALGASRGIEYLHAQGSTISHGNIKSSNILLTKLHTAKVSDHGLAHLVGPSGTPNRAGGYRAPEVTDPRKVSQKADVYSFGVLLLELLTGKPPTHALLNEEGVDLPRWVQSVVKEEWTSEVFDVELLRYQNVEDEMVQMLQLAIDCAAPYPDNRPAMPEVTRRIHDLCRNTLREQDEDHLVKEAD